MMNGGQVIRGWVEYLVDYRVAYQILGKFLSEKVDFTFSKKNFRAEKENENGSVNKNSWPKAGLPRESIWPTIWPAI